MFSLATTAVVAAIAPAQPTVQVFHQSISGTYETAHTTTAMTIPTGLISPVLAVLVSPVPSTILVNGSIPMTPAGPEFTAWYGVGRWYILPDPPTGSVTITVTYGSFVRIWVSAVVVDRVSRSAPVESYANATEATFPGVTSYTHTPSANGLTLLGSVVVGGGDGNNSFVISDDLVFLGNTSGYTPSGDSTLLGIAQARYAVERTSTFGLGENADNFGVLSLRYYLESPAYEVVRYVDTTAGAGGTGTNASPYNSLPNAMNAERLSRSDLAGRWERLTFRCRGGADVTGGFAFGTFNTNSNCYIEIIPDTNHAHPGYYDTTKYRLESGLGTGAFISDVPSHTRFTGLQMAWTNTLFAYPVILTIAATQDYALYLDQCVFHTTIESIGSSTAVNIFQAVRKSLYMRNCVFSGGFDTALTFSFASVGSQIVVYNNTVVGVNSGLNVGDNPSGSVRLFNNRVQLRASPTGSCYAISPSTASGGNMSSDASSPQAVLRNLTGTFENSGIFNFKPVGADPGMNLGTDLSADSFYPVQTDIVGVLRSSTPDIGAWEVAVTGPRPAGGRYRLAMGLR